MRISQILLFFLCKLFCCYSLEIQIETPYAALINAETGKVLFEKNARTKIYPCSTMKLATILYILEHKAESLDEIVTVFPEALMRTTEQEKKAHNYQIPAHYLEPDGTMIYIRNKENLSIRSLLYGALLKSGNDACNALAYHMSGEINEFVSNLNDWVTTVGAEATNFMNPHGLHHPQHYSCAYDMALIGKAAYHNKDFMKLATERIYTKPRTNLQRAETWKSNSCILRQGDELYYSKTLFAKTGQLKIGKYNLIAAATNGERTLIAALHKSPNWKQRYLDVIHMFETAFQEEKIKRLLFAKEETSFEKNLPKAKKTLQAVLNEDVFLEYFASEEPKVTSKLVWEENLTLPIRKGTKVATIELTGINDKSLLSVDLYAKDKVKKKVILRPKWAIIGACLFVFLGVRLFQGGKKNPE